MALLPTGEASSGIWGAVKNALSIFGGTNKVDDGADPASPTGMPEEEFESGMTETEIIELTTGWKREYSVYYADIRKSQEISFDYWIGKHRSDSNANVSSAMQNTTDPLNMVDNLIFEAIETFLPIATRANPDPLVSSDPSEMGQQVAHDLKAGLVNWADKNILRRKLAKMARHWLLNRIGCAKLKWDPLTGTICLDIIQPKTMIFDPDGHVDERGYFIGTWLGQKKKSSASFLCELFSKKKSEITLMVKGKMATKLEYIEWWYEDRENFYTLGNLVLGKYKNPNWNYDGTTKVKDPETGAEIETEVQGVNHLEEMRSPYIFLSIFNTGEQPHDETSLILQNLSIQDLVNRRWRQLDKNIESMNNGMVVSGTAFTEEQAAQVNSTLRRGGTIRVPNGKITDAAQRLAAPSLSPDVFRNLEDARSEERNIFGTAGSTAEGTQQQKSVRGKILVNQMDSSRIGGGVTEYIEQVADSIYNMVVQFMFVYYDEEHWITSAGDLGGRELISLKNDKFPLLKTLHVTVKEGSMIPKDPLTQRNEAIDLWNEKAIDPLNFFKRLDFPDPANITQQLILWNMLQQGQIQPQQYLPSFQIPQPAIPQGMLQGGAPQGAPQAPQQGENPAESVGTQEPIGQRGRELIQAVPLGR